MFFYHIRVSFPLTLALSLVGERGGIRGEGLLLIERTK
jgi:hypothetical protein